MSLKQKIIATGAEAIIILRENEIIKKRVKKSYRINELDERIRKLRTRSEARILDRARKIVPVPKLIESSEKSKEIKLEYIKGLKLSENLFISYGWTVKLSIQRNTEQPLHIAIVFP